MKLLIAYGSLGKYFHLKEFADELERQDVEVKLVHDIEYSKGFPSKKISDWSAQLAKTTLTLITTIPLQIIKAFSLVTGFGGKKIASFRSKQIQTD